MKQISQQAYLTEEETTRRLDVTADELTALLVEGLLPPHTLNGRENIYLEADVEHIRSTMRP